MATSIDGFDAITNGGIPCRRTTLVTGGPGSGKTGGEKFDLVLCDLMMPDMTGMDLHAELSIIAPEQASGMIFLTGGAFTENARTFLANPPKEHIEKPFDASNLRATVRRYLQSTQ
jgi:CheY-like chemotaxis protein